MKGEFVTATQSNADVAETRNPPGAGPAEAEGALKAIYQRRAVRAYTDEPVPREEIEQLLEAAIHAPSAVNLQPWGFVVIQDRETLTRYAEEGKMLLLGDPPTEEVVESGFSGNDWLRQMAASADFAIFHGAPALVVIYATSSGGTQDCFLAAENLMLAAWTLGLGTCPVGLALPLFNRKEVKADLNVPSDWVAALPITVGWPAGETPPTTRRPAQIVAWR
jgi:nitroreductase